MLGGGGILVAIGKDDLGGKLVPWLVGSERIEKVLPPLGRLHVLVSPPLHEGDVKGNCHVTRVLGRSEQAINERGAFARGLAIDKHPRFGAAWNAPGEIKISTTHKSCIRGRVGKITNLATVDKLIDAHVQRFCRRGSHRREAQDEAQPVHIYWNVAQPEYSIIRHK